MTYDEEKNNLANLFVRIANSMDVPVDSFGDFPFPTGWQAPTIIANNGWVTVIPAHPTNFQRRVVGQADGADLLRQ